MELETVFAAANGVAALSWIGLAVAPQRWSWPIHGARVVAALLSMLYVALILSFWARGEGGFDSLANVARLFEHSGLLLAGWVHYLAFDLLIGSWERQEAARIGLSHGLLLPCLFLTFMLGPAGWLVFLAARRYQKGSLS